LENKAGGGDLVVQEIQAKGWVKNPCHPFGRGGVGFFWNKEMYD